MQVSSTSLALAVAVVGAATFAFFHDDLRAANAARTVSAPASQASLGGEALPGEHVPLMDEALEEPSVDAVEPSKLSPALTWKAPASWPAAPNPNEFRIATHTVPRAKGDSDDAELTISRAGGDVDSNVQRWIEQFEESSGDRRRERTAAGFKVTVVEVSGTYQGGMGAATAPHPGWALLAAIVAAPDEPYFFKLTGPAATVHAARPAFDARIDGLVATSP